MSNFESTSNKGRRAARWAIALRGVAPWVLIIGVALSLNLRAGLANSVVAAAATFGCLLLVGISSRLAEIASGADRERPEEDVKASWTTNALHLLEIDQATLGRQARAAQFSLPLVSVYARAGWVVVGVALAALFCRSALDFL